MATVTENTTIADLLEGLGGIPARRVLFRPTPGTEKRSCAMYSETFLPGSWPPSPGLAPCAILI